MEKQQSKVKEGNASGGKKAEVTQVHGYVLNTKNTFG